MKRKIYAKYNCRSKLIEFTFIDVNDDEAVYKYEQANIKAEEENPFYRSEDYKLICLGVLKMEGEPNEVGIIYDYAKDFPCVFGEIADFQKPKYNSRFFEKMKVSEEKEKEITQKAGI